MNKTWSEAEKKFIKDNASILKDAVIAEKLTEMSGRKIGIQSVRKQRQKLGLLKASGRGFCKLRPVNVPNSFPLDAVPPEV
jgi:hypothetical protein